MTPEEQRYVSANWPLLSALHESLAGRQDLRLAVLFGSLARGDADVTSDLDLLVATADDSPSARYELTADVRRISGRYVDLAHLAHVEARAPLLLDRILDDGRVLVDRDGQWAELNRRRPAIRLHARRAHRREMAAAAHAIKELAG